MKRYLYLLFIFIHSIIFSQNTGIGINPTGNSPDASAALDVDYDNKGFLMPRLTTVQRNAIANPAVGLQIYNITTDCFQIYTPIAGWHDVACDCGAGPSSAFTFTDSVAINGNASFNASSSGMTYSWLFDQGSPANSNQQSPTSSWSAPGTYNVTLTVTDPQGCSSTTTHTITIINCPPPLAVTFTNCNQTGYTGPSQNQCNSAYSATPLNGLVTVVGGKQQIVVPFSGNYEIEVAGAPGGGASDNDAMGGKGVKIRATFPLTQGDLVSIMVGQMGGRFAGGGGTFVAVNSNPLIVAGGGGGTGNNGSSNPAIIDAVTNTTGNNGAGGGGAGGNNGNGGGGGIGGCCPGGGGGGFLTNGGNGSYPGGQSFNNGGVGGSGYNGGGGFGGGGESGFWGGGGGGGYSGGGGGYTDYNEGGGGGSYIDVTGYNAATTNGQYNGTGTFNGSSITNLGSYHSSYGYVNITLICP